MIRILAVIPTLRDDPSKTIESLIAQTIPIQRILVAVGSKNLYNFLTSHSVEWNHPQIQFIYVKPSSDICVGKRIAKALNVVLRSVNLEEFDYLLRVDADTVLPDHFVEENLKLNAHIVGSAGFALLIKVKPFLHLSRGRFQEVCAEDSYLLYSFMQNGCSAKPWKVMPKLLRESGKPYSWKYFYVRGVEMYKIGYEPLHVIGSLKNDSRNVFSALAYLCTLMSRSQRYPFSKWVFRKQLEKLTKLLKL